MVRRSEEIRARRGRKKSERGAALLLALTAITVLAAFSVEFAYNMRVSVHQEANLRREVQAYFNARSAMEIARAVILIDTVLGKLGGTAGAMSSMVGNMETWRYAPKFVEIFATGKANFLGEDLIDLSESDGIGVENGGFECEIIAEDGKINVAKVSSAADKTLVVQSLYAVLRQYFGIDQMQTRDRDAVDLIMNIIDWVDADESRSDLNDMNEVVDTGGAEGGGAGYGSYGYEPRNAKPDTNEELRLVEGMTDELFCEVGSQLSVYSTDKLNINEANIDVILALVLEFTPLEQQLQLFQPSAQFGLMSPLALVGMQVEMCRQISKELMRPAFRNAAAFAKAVNAGAALAGISLQLDQQQLGQIIGFGSKVLRVRARGYTTNSKNEVLATKTLEAVIDTSTDAFVYWREF